MAQAIVRVLLLIFWPWGLVGLLLAIYLKGWVS